MAKYHNHHSNSARYNRRLKMWESNPILATHKSGPKAFDQLGDSLGPGEHYFFFTSLLKYKGPQAAMAQKAIGMGHQAFDISA